MVITLFLIGLTLDHLVFIKFDKTKRQPKFYRRLDAWARRLIRQFQNRTSSFRLKTERFMEKNRLITRKLCVAFMPVWRVLDGRTRTGHHSRHAAGADWGGSGFAGSRPLPTADPARSVHHRRESSMHLIGRRRTCQKLFPIFRKCLKNVKFSSSREWRGDGETRRVGESFPAFLIRRPIAASPCQLNQRFPSRLTTPLSIEEIISYEFLRCRTPIASTGGFCYHL